jgi:hypothetical protein
MTKEQEEQGFRITDKRGFREDGETRAAEGSEKAEDKASGPQSSPTADKNPANQETPPRPPIDFTSYILTYYYQGLACLGVIPNPLTNKTEEDLASAQNTIDLLSMLEQKTKGNLGSDEQKFIEDVLYELRMRFMAKTNRIKY